MMGTDGMRLQGAPAFVAHAGPPTTIPDRTGFKGRAKATCPLFMSDYPLMLTSTSRNGGFEHERWGDPSRFVAGWGCEHPPRTGFSVPTRPTSVQLRQ